MKEKKFEKVVEWDFFNAHWDVLLTLFPLLLIGFFWDFFGEEGSVIRLLVMISYIFFFVAKVIVFIKSNRKVYWREK